MRLIAYLVACVAVAGCGADAGVSSPSQPAAPIPTAVTSPPAVGTSVTAPRTPSTGRESTPTPAATRPPEPTATPVTVHIGSTSGQSIYLYNSPTIGDRIQAYPEGTMLVVIGGDVEGDGLIWHFVRASDGTEGYIPVNDTLPSDAG